MLEGWGRLCGSAKRKSGKQSWGDSLRPRLPQPAQPTQRNYSAFVARPPPPPPRHTQRLGALAREKHQLLFTLLSAGSKRRHCKVTGMAPALLESGLLGDNLRGVLVDPRHGGRSRFPTGPASSACFSSWNLGTWAHGRHGHMTWHQTRAVSIQHCLPLRRF